ncbi:MAG: DinB family protein [Krumholzibacteria bacterium]|nr:DinB family protein [Candidatus Krumholzibacteria bacterium]
MNFDLDETLALLARTPATLRALLSGLPEPWLRCDEGPGTWSPFAVASHLADSELTGWVARAKVVLGREGDGRFAPVDRNAHLQRNRDRRLDEVLDEFAARREANLAELRALGITAADLVRTAEHPELGTVTLAQLLATWCVHDLGHLAQVARVMSKRYGRDVGPWEKYLSVLHR